MRGKKDDKRVLRSGNGRQKNSKRKIRRRNSNSNRHFNSNNQPVNRRRNRQKRKTNKSLVLIMIIALIAFVIGAGIGVSLSLDDGSDDGPQFENVTKEMTSNLNDTEPVYFDKDIDGVDFNENETSQLDIQYQYSEN